jgi:ubiquinone/menaquinone biosynthesis C-methylase UbiE
VRDTAGAQADRDRETVRVRHLYDALAARYDRAIALAERLLFDDGRRWLCAQARGDVLEVAVGTGRNLPYYPPDVRLMGIELSPAMLEIARRHARELGRVADLHVGDAQALAFPDASFDTVVCAIALCTIPDERRAVAEAARVLRPGGRLLALEHVRSQRWPVRAVQRVLEPLTVRWQADHLLREPAEAARAAGLEIERLEHRKWGIVERLVARKPASLSR